MKFDKIAYKRKIAIKRISQNDEQRNDNKNKTNLFSAWKNKKACLIEKYFNERLQNKIREILTIWTFLAT